MLAHISAMLRYVLRDIARILSEQNAYLNPIICKSTSGFATLTALQHYDVMVPLSGMRFTAATISLDLSTSCVMLCRGACQSGMLAQSFCAKTCLHLSDWVHVQWESGHGLLWS